MHQCRSSLFFGELWQGQKRMHRSLVIFPVKVDGANTPVCRWISSRKGRWHKRTSPCCSSLFTSFTSDFSRNYPCGNAWCISKISVTPAGIFIADFRQSWLRHLPVCLELMLFWFCAKYVLLYRRNWWHKCLYELSFDVPSIRQNIPLVRKGLPFHRRVRVEGSFGFQICTNICYNRWRKHFNRIIHMSLVFQNHPTEAKQATLRPWKTRCLYIHIPFHI